MKKEKNPALSIFEKNTFVRSEIPFSLWHTVRRHPDWATVLSLTLTCSIGLHPARLCALNSFGETCSPQQMCAYVKKQIPNCTFLSTPLCLLSCAQTTSLIIYTLKPTGSPILRMHQWCNSVVIKSLMYGCRAHLKEEETAARVELV